VSSAASLDFLGVRATIHPIPSGWGPGELLYLRHCTPDAASRQVSFYRNEDQNGLRGHRYPPGLECAVWRYGILLNGVSTALFRGERI